MKRTTTYVFMIALLACVALPAVLLSNPTLGTKETREDLPAQAGALRPLQEFRQDIRELRIGHDWIKWIMGIGFTVMGVCLTALLTVMLYLHSDTKHNIQRLETSARQDKQELKQDIQKLETSAKQDKEELKQGIAENRKLLIQIIQKQDKR